MTRWPVLKSNLQMKCSTLIAEEEFGVFSIIPMNPSSEVTRRITTTVPAVTRMSLVLLIGIFNVQLQRIYSFRWTFPPRKR